MTDPHPSSSSSSSKNNSNQSLEGRLSTPVPRNPAPPSIASNSNSSSTTRIRLAVPTSDGGQKKPTTAYISDPTGPVASADKTAMPEAPTNAAAAVAPTPAKSIPKKTKKSSKKKHKLAKDWPSSSAESLPKLSDFMTQRVQERNLDFQINGECTAMKLSPTGRLLLATFSDGTVRLFDLTGIFAARQHGTDSLEQGLFDMDSSEGSSVSSESASLSPSLSPAVADSYSATKLKKGSRNQFVCSRQHQRFGAVACQIHAKGVHTSMLMDLDVAEDGQWAFAGASRGSSQMVAIYLGAFESFCDKYLAECKTEDPPAQVDLLDLITVYRKSDAKLRGFGACTRLRDRRESNKYLLFTGKFIKRMHVWEFAPSQHGGEDDAKWTQLYDTNTNGNSITYLQFRYDQAGLLQGISKSDSQKLRVWDLSYEQHLGNSENKFYKKRSVIQKFALEQEKQPRQRPKCPTYVDVSHSETTLGVSGGFAFCNGGSAMFNNISLVSIDVQNVQSSFNHTELALPGGPEDSGMLRPSRRQRGELKSIVAVAGMVVDAGHVLLEVSDGSVVEYTSEGRQPTVLPVTIPGLDTIPQEGCSRKFCLARVGNVGLAVAAAAQYNSNTGRGSICLRALNEGVLSGALPRPTGFWGFAPQAALGNDSSNKRSIGVSLSSHPQKRTAVALSCDSPLHEPDISNWTNPPASTVTKKKAIALPSTSSHDNATNVQLFARESKKKSTSSTSSNDSKKTNPPASTATKTKAIAIPSTSSHDNATNVQLFAKESKKKSTSSDDSKKTNLLASAVAKRKTIADPSTSSDNATNVQLFAKESKKKTASLNDSKKKCKSPGLVSTATSSERAELVNVIPRSTARASKEEVYKETPTQPVQPKKQQRWSSQGNPLVAVATSTEQPADATDKSTKASPPASSIANSKTSNSSARDSKVNTVPATPQHVSAEGDSAAAGAKGQVAFANAVPTGVQQVSPESRPGTATKTGQSRKVENSIVKYFEGKAQAKGAPSGKNKTVENPCPSTTPPSIPRHECGTENELRGVAATLCEMGSTTKTAETSSKRPFSEVGSPGPTICQETTPRRKVVKRSSKNQVLSSGEFYQECNKQQQRLETILENHVPKTNIYERMGMSEASLTKTGDQAKDHEMARMRMAAQHRGAHEQILRRVVNAASAAVRAMKRCSSIEGVLRAEENWQESFKEYVEALDFDLWRQKHEASALAQQQTLERQGQVAPQLQVAFPFYHSFDDCIGAIESVVKVVR